jgi:hypothetical protein
MKHVNEDHGLIAKEFEKEVNHMKKIMEKKHIKKL